jgi:hypothetical protein
MKNSTPDFPPLRLDLLEEIKAEKEKIRTLLPGAPISGGGISELEEIQERQERIDEYTVKLIRSGAIKRGPDKVFHYPPEARAWAKGKRLDKPQIQHYYHPQLPPWGREHLEEWIQVQRLRRKGRETLRRTKVVGLETGMKRRRDLRLFFRFLELRGVEGKDDPDIEDDQIPDSLGETLDQSLKLAVTDEMLRIAKAEGEAEEKMRKSRVRKAGRSSLDSVIKKLVEEGLVKKVITPSGRKKNPSHQAFKQMLKNRYPHYPWDEV